MALSNSRKLIFSIIGIIAVIAVSLGVGLGIGLKKHDSNNPQTRVSNIQSKNNFPALGISQYEDGKSSIIVAGKRKYGAEPSALPTDPFHLGSNTKSMTATILAALIADGIFFWNTTISEVLRDTSLGSTLNLGHADTTLQMLTAQYSGLDSTIWQSNATFVTQLYDYSSFDGRYEFVQQVLSQPPKTLPNTKFFYDNINYMVVGLIMELKLNTTFEPLLVDRLFTPLDMQGCGLGPLPERSNSTIDSPWPHRFSGNSEAPVQIEGFPLTVRDNSPAFDPAGRVYCPLASYMRYLEAHLNGSLGLQQPLRSLKTEDWQLLQTAYMGGSYTSGGWQIDSKRAGLVVHTGSNTFNFAEAYVWPEKRKIGVVVTNVGAIEPDRAMTLARVVNDIVVEIVDGRVNIL